MLMSNSVAISLLISTAFVGSPPAVHRDRTVDLFNGRDLKGWEGDPRFWSVKDNAITAVNTAENPTKQNTFLIWRGGTVKDFQLRVEFRLQGNNSGIQYRSKDLGQFVVSGYQADMDGADRYTGILYEERGRGILANVGERVSVKADGKARKTGTVGDPAGIRAAIKNGGWNEYVITAVGNHIVQAINGKITVDVTDEDESRRAMEGILALQLHAGPPMTVQFRKLRLRVIDTRPHVEQLIPAWDPATL